MKVTIINNQNLLKINNKNIEKQVKTILKEEKVYTDEVILHFVNVKTIKTLHLKYFNNFSVTDCISFPIDSPKTQDLSNVKNDFHILGEAFICTKEAIKFSKKYKVDSYDELTLYVIHCILHLIGYNDINKKDISIMRKKENYYLSLLK